MCGKPHATNFLASLARVVFLPPTQSCGRSIWPATRRPAGVTGQIPSPWMASGSQLWLRISGVFDRVPTANSLAAPDTAAAPYSGL